MDCLNPIANVLTAATLAWQSCKATSELIDGLAETPAIINHSRDILSQTQNKTEVLEKTLGANSNPEFTSRLNSILEQVHLEVALKSVQGICDDFDREIKALTTHSVGEKLSKRDRLAVFFRSSKLLGFNRRLGDCLGCLTLTLETITLLVSCRTSSDVQQLQERFASQEEALSTLEKQLQEHRSDLQTADQGRPVNDAGPSPDDSHQRSELELNTQLQRICDQSAAALTAARTGQSFGDMKVEGRSKGFQGIAGQNDGRAEQKFGQMTVTGESRAAQGQLDAASFAALFSG